MDRNTINTMKARAEAAQAVYVAEQQRLVAAGFKSAQRYEMLKPLKAEADKLHAEYAKFANSQIMTELKKIIAKQTPAERAEGLRRARA